MKGKRAGGKNRGVKPKKKRLNDPLRFAMVMKIAMSSCSLGRAEDHGLFLARHAPAPSRKKLNPITAILPVPATRPPFC